MKSTSKPNLAGVSAFQYVAISAAVIAGAAGAYVSFGGVSTTKPADRPIAAATKQTDAPRRNTATTSHSGHHVTPESTAGKSAAANQTDAQVTPKPAVRTATTNQPSAVTTQPAVVTVQQAVSVPTTPATTPVAVTPTPVTSIPEAPANPAPVYTQPVVDLPAQDEASTIPETQHPHQQAPEVPTTPAPSEPVVTSPIESTPAQPTPEVPAADEEFEIEFTVIQGTVELTVEPGIYLFQINSTKGQPMNWGLMVGQYMYTDGTVGDKFGGPIYLVLDETVKTTATSELYFALVVEEDALTDPHVQNYMKVNGGIYWIEIVGWNPETGSVAFTDLRLKLAQ